MKNFFAISLLAVTAVLGSCNYQEDDMTPSDDIHLSQKTAEFKAAGDSVIVTTKGTGWWVYGVKVVGQHYYHFPDVDIEADSYIMADDGFIVERRNKTTLVIKLDANTLNTERVVRVELESGDYFDDVTVIQNAASN